MVKFLDQKYSVYRCTFVMQPRQRQLSAVQEKAKEKEVKREKKEENGGLNRKKKNKITSPCAYIFPPWPLRYDLSRV